LYPADVRWCCGANGRRGVDGEFAVGTGLQFDVDVGLDEKAIFDLCEIVSENGWATAVGGDAAYRW